jgi:FG-GAP-like repeat/FG-GAP repeat
MKRQSLLATLAAIVFTTAIRAANPIPLVYEPLSPASVAPGGPAFTLTVEGTDFVTGSVVHWNGSALPTHFVSGTKLTASVSSADIAKPKTAWITVSNPTPGGGTSNAVFLQIQQSQASVTLGSANPPLPSQSPNSVAVGDFNGDGFADLAFSVLTSTSSPGQILIQLGNGDGTFKTAAPYSSGAACPGSLIVGDFNGDGKPDLAVIDSCSSNLNGSVAVLLGNGNGTFQAPHVTALDLQGLFYIAAGDFNRDGKFDLAILNLVQTQCPSSTCVTGNVSIFLGNGNGTFQTPIETAIPANSGGNGEFAGLAVGDFNNDGKLDAVVGTAWTFLGNGAGAFESPITIDCSYCSSEATAGIGDPVAADINGDGDLDLILGAGLKPVILHGNGNGTFSNPSIYSLSSPKGVVVGDFNGDGKPDLAFLVYDTPSNQSNPDGVAIMLGEGGFSFGSPVFYPSGTANGTPGPSGGTGNGPFLWLLTGADFNNDGRPDLFYPVRYESTVNSESSFAYVELLNGLVPALTPPIEPFLTPQPVEQAGAAQFVTLTNNSSTAVDISSLKIEGPGEPDYSLTGTGTCPAVGGDVAAGDSCTIGVIYTPQTTANRSALISVSAGSQATTTTAALFSMAPIIDAEISPSSGSGTTQTFTLTLTNADLGGVDFGPPGSPACKIEYVKSDNPQVTVTGSGCKIGTPTVTYTDNFDLDVTITLPVTFASTQPLGIYTFAQYDTYATKVVDRGTWN